jgi:hypothetical protein
MLFGYRVVLSSRSFLLIRIILGLLFIAALFVPGCETSKDFEYTVWQSSWFGQGGLISPSGIGVWSLIATVGALINLATMVSFLLSFSPRNFALKATLFVAVQAFLFPLWICYWYAHMLPLPGHFLWVATALIIGLTSTLTIRDHSRS